MRPLVFALMLCITSPAIAQASAPGQAAPETVNPTASPTDAILQPLAGVAYADPDEAARAAHAQPGMNGRMRESLNRTIRQNPRNLAALIQRAYLFHASGDLEEGDRDFLRALELGRDEPLVQRRALWSLGWSALNRDQAPDAIEYWRLSIALHGGRPFWQPYTLAVAYWQLGDRETALAWYAAAAFSNPDWRTAEGVASRGTHWRDKERAAANALFAEWSARRGGAPATP